jgi:hypothetical protein
VTVTRELGVQYPWVDLPLRHSRQHERLVKEAAISGLNGLAAPASVSGLVGHGWPERPGYTPTGLGNCL